MRTSLRRRLAGALCSAMLHLSPPARGEWASAMEAELQHVEDARAPGFAAGCLWSAALWRLCTSKGVLAAGRICLALGSASMTLLGLWLLLRLGPGHDLAPMLAGLSLFYTGAAALAAWGRLALLASYAGAGLCLNSLVLAMLPALADRTDYERYLRAVVFEEYGLLTAMMAGVAVTTWLSRRAWLREHGA